MNEFDSERFARFALQTNAMLLFLRCQAAALQNVLSTLGGPLKLVGPNEEPFAEFLERSTAESVHLTLADLADKDPALASELRRILAQQMSELAEENGESEAE